VVVETALGGPVTAVGEDATDASAMEPPSTDTARKQATATAEKRMMDNCVLVICQWIQRDLERSVTKL
jgi:hypothetical protein